MLVINSHVSEVQPHRPSKAITLDTSFEKDPGVDSLTRIEVISRVEKNSSLHCLNKTSQKQKRSCSSTQVSGSKLTTQSFSGRPRIIDCYFNVSCF
jgi:aminopeptidase C